MPLTPYFKRPMKEVAADFLASKTIDDVCRCLEVPKGQMIFIIYKNGGVERHYKTFDIKKKSGGTRRINAPFGGLKIVHQKIQRILSFIDRRSPWSHGFHKGRSIITNARAHYKSAYVLNVDIEDFYRSIHFGRVSGIFKNHLKFDKAAADFLAHICCFKGALPAGSPCAPALSNLAAWALDQAMLKIAKSNKLTFSRYADDITFSAKMKRFPSSVGHYLDRDTNSGPSAAGPTLAAAFHEAGYKINSKKTRLQFRRHHQSVTGITVNEFPNVRRDKIKEIRKLIYLWKKFGSPQAAKFLCGPNAHQSEFLELIYGNLAYLKSVRGEKDTIFRKFCYDIILITSNAPEWIKLGGEEFAVRDVFLSHASEDKEKIVEPLYNACIAAGVSVFYDADAIQWGDSIIEKINKGLGEAKIFVPVITPKFLEKKWPRKELDSAFSRFMNDKTRILPIIHDVGDLSGYPLMNDVLYKQWQETADFPDQIAKLLHARVAMINP